MKKKELKELLKKANLSKKELANIIGISIGSLNNWGNTKDNLGSKISTAITQKGITKLTELGTDLAMSLARGVF